MRRTRELTIERRKVLGRADLETARLGAAQRVHEIDRLKMNLQAGMHIVCDNNTMYVSVVESTVQRQQAA